MRKLIILLVLPLCACSNQFSGSTCNLVDYSDKTEKIWGDFNELETLAYESTIDDKINLSSIMDHLQQTRDVYAQLELPSCYETTHSSYLEYMDLTIEVWSYVADGGEAGDSEYMNLLNASAEALNQALGESNKLGK
jgi:hypothetical protein